MSELNDFQVRTQDALRDILRNANLPASFEIGGGPDEFAAKVSFGRFEAWIYPDGANIGGPDTDLRYEIYDFDSLDELQKAFLAGIQRVLCAPTT